MTTNSTKRGRWEGGRRNRRVVRWWFFGSAAAVILLPYVLLPPVGTPLDAPGPTIPSAPARRSSVTIPSKVTARLGDTDSPTEGPASGGCAICFFGLPRSFRLLVLPSIVRNVLIPNRKNGCDIYLHYFHVDSEEGGRSGGGGVLDTDQVWLLHNVTADVNRWAGERAQVHLSIIKDTNETFWERRGAQLQRYKSARGLDGKRIYYPWMAKSYDTTSVDNIVRQWHSISEVWQEMERGAQRWGKNYTRVAMVRNDVVYVTPFDIYQISNSSRDDKNEMVAVPNWARFPINDRMVYGPYDAVKIWATERFDRLETHVRTYEPGYGLHSERFLNHSIFPAIRELGYTVVANPEICFFRARADGSAWINDCATRDGTALGFRTIDTQALVESLVGHSCVRSKFNKRTIQLHCNVDAINTDRKLEGRTAN